MNFEKHSEPTILIPLTKDEIIARALEAEKEISEKKFISLEELEEEMKSW